MTIVFTGLDFLKTLSEEELAKVPTLTDKEIEDAFRQGKEEARAWRKNQSCSAGFSRTTLLDSVDNQ